MTTANAQRKPRLDKDTFFRDLGYEPHEGQREIHASSHPRRIIACGVRWGKSLCAAMEGVAAAMQPVERSVGWIIAPTYDLADKVFREIILIVTGQLRHRLVTLRESEKRLVLRNIGGGTSEIRAKSADNPVSLLGEGLDWAIVDEAARLKPMIWQSHISQRLIDKKGWALLISTPRGKGYFYDLYRRGQRDDPDYQSWNYPSRTNPILDASVIEAERARLPERVFRQEFEAEFLEGAGAVFRNIRECATGEWSPPVHDRRYVAGLDLAKIEDFTVLCIVDAIERRVVHVDRYHRVDWETQVQRVKAALEKYNRAWATVDTTGVGEPVFESLVRAGVCVTPYPFTARSKSALINNLSMLLERSTLTLPRPELWPEGIDELESFEYSVTDAGNVRTGSPAGYHDDCVIGLALAAWPLRDRQGIRYGRTTGMW